MNTDSVRRGVTVERTAPGVFAATNTRGGKIIFGTGDGADFTPTELFLAAIGGCTDIGVTFRIAFPAGEQGENARAILPDAVQKSHDRLCTVGRTVEAGTPIATRIDRA